MNHPLKRLASVAILAGLLLAGFVLFPSMLRATTYYISTSGNDSNSGTSHLEAWKSTNKVNITVSNTSDDVLFYCGDRWVIGASYGPLTVDWNGTSTNPVIIGAYYLDTDGVTAIRGVQGTKPEFDGNSAYPTTGDGAALVYINNRQHVIFENFRIRRSLAKAITVEGAANYNIKILNVNVENTFSEGIFLNNVDQGLIQGCDFSRTCERRTCIIGSNPLAALSCNTNNKNILMQNNVFHENYAFAIRLITSNTHFVIENNLIYNTHYTKHVLLGNGTTDCDVRNNIIIGLTDPPLADWPAAPLTWPTAPGDGIIIEDLAIPVAERNRIYNNLIANCSNGINITSSNAALKDTFVYSNTLVDNRTNIKVEGPFSNCAVRNNLIWSISANSVPATFSNYTGLICDHNYWSVTPTAAAQGPGDIYGGLPLLYKTTGWRSIAPGGLAASDCEIAALSPAVDAGVDLSATYAMDITGTARPRIKAWDMGAWERVSENQMEHLSLTAVPFTLFYTETTNNLMAQINCQAANYDVLSSLRFDNTGTAIAGQDLVNLQLWHLAGGAGVPFNPTQAVRVASMVLIDENSWSVNSNLTLQNNDTLYVTADIPTGAKGGNTVQFSLPSGGAVFQYSRPLESAPLVNPALQAIRSTTLLTLETSPWGNVNLIQGQAHQPIGRVKLRNVSGDSLTLTTLQLAFQSKAGVPQNPGQSCSRLRLLRGSAPVSTLVSPFPLGALFSLSPALSLANQESAALDVYADILDAPALEGFQLLVTNSAALNSGHIQSSPVEGQFFPLTVADANIRPPSAEAVFSSFPNPFKPSSGPMRVAYYLESAGEAELSVWTLSGRRVATLEQADKPAGLYEIPWDGKNDQGRAVVSGPYLLRLELRYADAPSQRFSRKFVVAR